jgi:hypothetical protein
MFVRAWEVLDLGSPQMGPHLGGGPSPPGWFYFTGRECCLGEGPFFKEDLYRGAAPSPAKGASPSGHPCYVQIAPLFSEVPACDENRL